MWAGVFVQHVVHRCVLILLTLRNVDAEEEVIANVQIKTETFVKKKKKCIKAHSKQLDEFAEAKCSHLVNEMLR